MATKDLTPKEKVTAAQEKAARAMENFFNALSEAELCDFGLRAAPFVNAARFFDCTFTDNRFKVTPRKE